MRFHIVVALLGTTSLLACLPSKKSAGVQSTTELPSACKGGEFALTGFNKATKPQCLDVTNYPALKHFSNDSEYQSIAERFKMEKVLAIIQSRGVKAAQEEYALVANLKHDKKFWIAQIPLTQKVTRSVFQVAEFRIPVGSKSLDALPANTRQKIEALAKENPVVASELAEIKSGVYTAAHGQLRLTFSEPVVIAHEKDPETRSTLNEVILSVHAVSPGSAPDTYDPIKGFQNEYGTASGIYSLDDKANQSISRHVFVGNPPSLVRQYKLQIDAKQMDLVLRKYFERAKYAWENLAYNTGLRNCGSEIFESLDAVTGFSRDKEAPLSVLGRQYPKYAQYALFSRGMISLQQGVEADAFGGFKDSHVAGAMLSLNQELGMPEPR